MRATFREQTRQRVDHRILALASLAFLTGLVVHATLLSPSHANSDDRRSSAPVTAEPARAADAPASPPPHLEKGVPAGFARTSDGAVSAAAAFVCTGQAILNMDPLSAEDAIRQMAATSTADQQVAEMLTKLRTARSALSAGTGATVYRQAAVAWRVESFDSGRARIAIWSVGVLARDGVAPPQAGWATSTFDLVWERNDWKVEHEVIVPGPAPILDNSAAPATADQLISALQGFTDFGNPA